MLSDWSIAISKMAAPGTREKLLSLINDIEKISKELFEIISLPKSQRSEGPDSAHLLNLLVTKDEEIQNCLLIAKKQAEVQQKTDALKAEIDKRDADIRQLQKNLKDAEALLATAIYQAKQRLQSIKQSESKAIPSEELIKYAHKISAGNAVAAPPTWQPGDPRRPYPTDIEMRMGFLGRLSDLPINNQLLMSNFPDQVQATARHRAQLDQGVVAQQTTPPMSTWQQSHDHHLTSSLSHGHMTSSMDVRTQNKENEDVEVMSTDSSSSSSSDE